MRAPAQLLAVERARASGELGLGELRDHLPHARPVSRVDEPHTRLARQVIPVLALGNRREDRPVRRQVLVGLRRDAPAPRSVRAGGKRDEQQVRPREDVRHLVVGNGTRDAHHALHPGARERPRDHRVRIWVAVQRESHASLPFGVLGDCLEDRAADDRRRGGAVIQGGSPVAPESVPRRVQTPQPAARRTLPDHAPPSGHRTHVGDLEALARRRLRMRFGAIGAVAHEVKLLTHVIALTGGDLLEVRRGHVHHRVRASGVEVLEGSRQEVVDAGRELGVHVGAGERVVEVEHEWQSREPAEDDPGEPCGVGHHEHDDRAGGELADQAPAGEDRGHHPEDGVVGPHDQLQELVQAQAPHGRQQPPRSPAAHDLDAHPAAALRALGLGHHRHLPARAQLAEQLARPDRRGRGVRRERLRQAQQRRASSLCAGITRHGAPRPAPVRRRGRARARTRRACSPHADRS